MAVTLNSTGNASGFILCSDTTGEMSLQTLGTTSISISNTQVATFSSQGNANIVTISGIGINVTGTFNSTGTITAGAVTYPNTDGTASQVLSTYGNGVAYWSAVVATSLANGNSNVSIPAANGNINISAVGNANILVVTGTGANIAGTANVTGNANVGNLGVEQVLASGNITATQFISNISTGTAPLVVTSTTVVANLNANALQGNTPSETATANSIVQRNADGNITANFFIGNGSQLTGVIATSLANGNSNITIPSASGNVNISAVGNANVLAITGTGVNIAGTLNATGVITGNGNGISSIQAANITGTITSATNAAALLQNTSVSTTVYPTFTTSSANGNSQAVFNTGISANLANSSISATTFVGTLSGAATSASLAGSVTNNAQSNITSVGTLTSLTVSGATNLGAVGNVTITGGTNGQVLTTNGSGGLSFTTINTTTPNISNGTSNVNIPTSSGNVNTSVGGTANVLVVTSSGANITGTFNATANANVGNIGATNGVFSTLNVSGNANVGNIGGTGGVFTTVAGTLTTAAQPNITSVGTLTSLTATGNITGNYFLGNGSQLSGISLPAIEPVTVLTNSTGTVTHNYNLGGVFVHTFISGNFTAAFANVPTTNNNVVSFTLALVQGATPYLPTAVTINGSSVSVGYAGGTITGTANKTDIIVYAFFRVNNAWLPLTGALTSY